MSNGYTTVDGEIRISLPPVDFLELLKEIDGCEDLLKPHIRFENNTVIFRDQDLKLLIPEEFYKAEIPKYQPSLFIKKVFAVITAIGLLICGWLWYSKNIHVMFGGIIWGGFWLSMLWVMLTAIAEVRHTAVHRRVLYIKAKLTSFLYMQIMQDLVTQSNRLERSNARLNQEVSDLKNLVRDAYVHVPVVTRLDHLTDTFPDGEEIVTVKKKYN